MTDTTRFRTGPILGAVAVGLVAAAAWHFLLADTHEQRTNDAFIAADFTLLTPKVSGIVDDVLVSDNQPVKAGQLLARLDDRDYRAALACAEGERFEAQANLNNATAQLARQTLLIEQAKATLNVDEAELVFVRHEQQRYQHLAQSGAGTLQNAQQAQSREDTAKARQAQHQAALGAARKQVDVLLAQQQAAQGKLQVAQARVQQAELDLAHTRIVAPIDGVIGRREVRVGAYVKSADILLAIVPVAQAYALANFQEDQLTDVRPGQAVRLDVDMFPGQPLRAHVQSLAPATGVTFAAVAPDNATGNFTKVTQRIPVKIQFEKDQPLLDQLRVGMSVEVTITLDDTPTNSTVAQVAP